MEPLVTPEQLEPFGGLLPPAKVEAAAAQVRALCGWHIAPVITETVHVDSEGGTLLVLPTLRLVELVSVTDVDGNELDDVSWSRHGYLRRTQRFPEGPRAVEVTMRHGYDTVPADLLGAIAERTSRRVLQESLGSRSVSYAVDDPSTGGTLSLYRLGPRP